MAQVSHNIGSDLELSKWEDWENPRSPLDFKNHIHPEILELSKEVVKYYGDADYNHALLFPAYKSAKRCKEYMKSMVLGESITRSSVSAAPQPKPVIISLRPKVSQFDTAWSSIFAVLFSNYHLSTGMKFWRLFGEGISSRCAEQCKLLLLQNQYRTVDNSSRTTSTFYTQEMLLTKRNITATVLDTMSLYSPDILSNAYLYPSYAKAMFEAFNLLTLSSQGSGSEFCKASFIVIIGTTSFDTFRLISHVAQGRVINYVRIGETEVDNLKKLIKQDFILAIFFEAIDNSKALSDHTVELLVRAQQHKIPVLCHSLVEYPLQHKCAQYVTIYLIDLAQAFSGSWNVLGGMIIFLNPQLRLTGPDGNDLSFVDTFHPEDAKVMLENIGDFQNRLDKMSSNAQHLWSFLTRIGSGVFRNIFYPMEYPPSHVRHLLGLSFIRDADAKKFFNNLQVLKGPWDGSKSTSACPYGLYHRCNDLSWPIRQVYDQFSVRISVGCESKEHLELVFGNALNALRSGFPLEPSIYSSVLGNLDRPDSAPGQTPQSTVVIGPIRRAATSKGMRTPLPWSPYRIESPFVPGRQRNSGLSSGETQRRHSNTREEDYSSFASFAFPKSRKSHSRLMSTQNEFQNSEMQTIGGQTLLQTTSTLPYACKDLIYSRQQNYGCASESEPLTLETQKSFQYIIDRWRKRTESSELSDQFSYWLQLLGTKCEGEKRSPKTRSVSENGDVGCLRRTTHNRRAVSETGEDIVYIEESPKNQSLSDTESTPDINSEDGSSVSQPGGGASFLGESAEE